MTSATGFTLGDSLRKARKSANLDQDQLAARLGVSSKTVSRWERDEHQPPFDMMIRVARITGRDIGWFTQFVPESDSDLRFQSFPCNTLIAA